MSQSHPNRRNPPPPVKKLRLDCHLCSVRSHSHHMFLNRRIFGIALQKNIIISGWYGVYVISSRYMSKTKFGEKLSCRVGRLRRFADVNSANLICLMLYITIYDVTSMETCDWLCGGQLIHESFFCYYLLFAMPKIYENNNNLPIHTLPSEFAYLFIGPHSFTVGHMTS